MDKDTLLEHVLNSDQPVAVDETDIRKMFGTRDSSERLTQTEWALLQLAKPGITEEQYMRKQPDEMKAAIYNWCLKNSLKWQEPTLTNRHWTFYKQPS
jgi:hypothetical protein